MSFDGVQGILFDLDGTLTDYDAGCEAGLRAALDVLNADREKPLLWDVFQEAYFGVIEAESLWSSSGGFRLPARENRARRFRILFDALGLKPGAILHEMADAYGIGRSSGTCLLPGVLDGLQRYVTRYRLGVITEGAVDTQTEQLENHNIKNFFEEIIISGATPWHKPSQNLYNYAVRMMKLEPGNIVMIGDRLDWDIQPAKEVGMKTIYLNHTPNKEEDTLIEQFADKVVFNFNELRSVL